MSTIKLLCDISEMNWVFSDSASIDGYLQKIVAMTAHHMHAAVSSIYFYDDIERLLVLKATFGLNTALINQVKLKPGEGICGLAFKELKPMCENQASSHPRYKFFDGLQEECYEAFLAVPIMRGILGIGVLVVQRKKGRDFTQKDVTTLRVVSSQLANIVENARELIALRKIIPNRTVPERRQAPVRLKLVKGKTAAGGFTCGPLRIETRSGVLETIAARADEASHSLDDFMRAVTRTRRQLKERQEAVGERLSDVASLIFTAHLLLLEDDLFFGKIVGRIREGISAEKAILETVRHYVGIFSAMENQLLREKIDDISDLALRLFDNLSEERRKPRCVKGCVIIAHDLLPSDVLVFASEGIGGIVLISGGVSSHLAVLTRSLGLPLIIADEPRLLDLPDTTRILLDGETGNVYINPSEAVLTPFLMRENARREEAANKASLMPETFTADGAKVTILANINLLTDVKTAIDLKCEGVGLYRTEFPFIIRSDFPTEEEQFVIYRKLVTGMNGKQVTFRTMDIGGDKVLSYYDHFSEQNPFLGLRSTRFALRNLPVFRQQVRAILRAGHDADLRIMFPMISSVEELDETNAVVDACIDELRSEGTALNAVPKRGIMLEIPAIMEIIDELAVKTDFFSIGTNDFVQYMLAVDRTNEKVSSLYTPHHPAVLRALARIVRSAVNRGTPVTVCGDMAHRTEYIPFLLGIGIRELSIDGMYIPRIKNLIAATKLTEARNIAAAALAETSVRNIAELFGLKE